MRALFTLLVIAALIGLYIWKIRPYLKGLPSLAEIFRQEDSLFTAIRVYFEGRKTILASIWLGFIAWAPDALTAISGFDLKTLLHLPDEWALYISALIPVLTAFFRSLAKDD